MGYWQGGIWVTDGAWQPPGEPAGPGNNPTGGGSNMPPAGSGGGGGGGGGGGAPAAPAGQYGDYALDSLHLANGHLFGEKRVISGDPNNPGQSKYDYQTVDLGDSTTPEGIAAIAAATTIPVDVLNQQLAVLKDQNAQTAKGSVSTNFEYAGSYNGQDIYSATAPDGTRQVYAAKDLVGAGWANQNDLDVIKQNYQYSQNKMAAGNRLQNVTAMGNGMYAVTNPDGSRTTMNGQQVIATQSATQTDLDLLDREKTQKDLDYARDTGLASKVSNISYAGNGQYSATDYYGAHGTYGANQLLTGQPAPPVPPQPPSTGAAPAATGAQQPPPPAPAPPATQYPPSTQAQTPSPTPTALPGGPNYGAPAPSPAPTSTTSSAALGVTSSTGAGQGSSGSGPTPQMAGGGRYMGVQTGGDAAAGGNDRPMAGGGNLSSAAGGGAAASSDGGSATQAELDQARNQWNQQQAAAYKQKLMGTSRSGVGMGFSGSQTATSFTGVQ